MASRRTITLDVSLDGPLLVAGGQALDLGIHLATIRRLHQGYEVPYIPATALRGAVRIQLEALLAGDRQEVTTPYPLDDAGETLPADRLRDPVARLFGHSGRQGERDGAKEGALRFSDALPAEPERAASAFGLRPGVELDDYTSSAEDRKLYFRQVVDVSGQPLVFRARLDFDESRLLAEGLAAGEIERLQGFLRAAVETTEAIGADKSKGGGRVRITWREGAEEHVAATVSGDPASATRARLLFTLEEPAHFGDGGPHGNHHATKSFIPGATVRGAIAWALLRNGKARPEDGGFKALFLENPPVSFGDALLVQEPGAEPSVRPATARESRFGKESKDVLVSELARDRVNALLEQKGFYLGQHDGNDRLNPVSPRPASGLVRRTRTRVSLDRWTGTAAEGRLFSIEQLEPWLVEKNRDPEEPRPVRFAAWVEGLTPAAAALLNEIEGIPVLAGAGRNHGLGLARVDVRFEGEPAEGEPLARIRELARKIDHKAAELAVLAEGSTTGPAPGLPVALVALSEYVPGDPEAPHPLAELGLSGAPAPVRRFLNPGFSGGYDQRPGEAPLKDLRTAAGAGSVYVYEIAEETLADALAGILPALRKGVGQRTESGCGRFILFDPNWSVQAKEKPMSGQLKSEVKRELVKKAERAFEEAEKKPGYKDGIKEATAQLRNLVQITQQETEISVLKNFLQYQRGRDATKKFWNLIYQEVLAALHWIRDHEDLDDAARKAAVQNYFGYLVRHYVYLEAIRKEKEEEERKKKKKEEEARRAAQGGARR